MKPRPSLRSFDRPIITASSSSPWTQAVDSGFEKPDRPPSYRQVQPGRRKSQPVKAIGCCERGPSHIFEKGSNGIPGLGASAAAQGTARGPKRNGQLVEATVSWGIRGATAKDRREGLPTTRGETIFTCTSRKCSQISPGSKLSANLRSLMGGPAWAWVGAYLRHGIRRRRDCDFPSGRRRSRRGCHVVISSQAR